MSLRVLNVSHMLFWEVVMVKTRGHSMATHVFEFFLRGGGGRGAPGRCKVGAKMYGNIEGFSDLK